MIAKLGLLGIPPERVARMTLRQIHYIACEIKEDSKQRWKMAGWEVQEEDKEATLQDLLGFGM